MVNDRKQKEDIQCICKICYTEIEIKDLNPLDCGHFYHEECLEQYLTLKITEKDFPLVCPDLECKKEINPSDLKG